MASEPHNRFDQIDPSTETALRTLEGRIEYEFTTPVLLWEALQFPGSMMDWDDDQTNNGLAEVGDTAIALAFASTEYQRNNISDFDRTYHPHSDQPRKR